MRSSRASSAYEPLVFVIGVVLAWVLLTGWLPAVHAAVGIPSCQGAAAVGPSLSSLTGGSTPTTSAGQRPASHRYPVFSNQGSAVTFWDFVPAEFFIVIGRTRSAVETMTTEEWLRAFARWRVLERSTRNGLFSDDVSIALHTIDWLYVMARDAEFVRDDEAMRLGLVGAFEVDPTLSPSRLLSEPPGDEMLWLTVAALYVDARLDVTSTRAPRSMRMREATWHVFEDSSVSSLEAQTERLRSYLCHHPEIRYLATRAQRLASSDDPALRRRSESDLQDLDAYVERSLADFAEFFDLVNAPAQRSKLLDLVRAGRERDFVGDMLDRSGAAKGFLQMRQVIYDVIGTYGERGEPIEIWRRLPAHVRFAWPDPCLGVASYPTRTSHVFAAPWVMRQACDLPHEDRDELHALLQETP